MNTKQGARSDTRAFVSERPLVIYDTTLRDGAQTPGCYMDTETKLIITKRLSELGVDYIEGGFVGANKTDRQYFERVMDSEPRSRIAVFGRTGKDVKAMKALKKYGLNTFTIVGKSFRPHVKDVLGMEPNDYLKIIKDSVSQLRDIGEVIFDAEFFFTAWKQPDTRDYAYRALENASDADWIVLCDTTGVMSYRDVAQAIEDASSIVPLNKIGVHFHNDRGQGVACSLEAFYNGVSHIQGTMNGLGERCGNTDLIEFLGNLYEEGIIANRTKDFFDVAHSISKMTGIPLPPNKPYVGRNAFAHSAGMHSDAMLKVTNAYQRVDPSTFGNKTWYPLSSQSGRAVVVREARRYGFQLNKNDPVVSAILEDIDFLGEVGDAQFLAILYKRMGNNDDIFSRVTRRIIDVYARDSFSEATVKLNIGNKRFSEVSEGEGPVHAMDIAFKKAIGNIYPDINNVELVDYEVHVIPGKWRGTASEIRVFAEFRINEERFTSVARDRDILRASQKVLEDAYRFYLIKKHIKS